MDFEAVWKVLQLLKSVLEIIGYCSIHMILLLIEFIETFLIVPQQAVFTTISICNKKENLRTLNYTSHKDFKVISI